MSDLPLCITLPILVRKFLRSEYGNFDKSSFAMSKTRPLFIRAASSSFEKADFNLSELAVRFGASTILLGSIRSSTV